MVRGARLDCAEVQFHRTTRRSNRTGKFIASFSPVNGKKLATHNRLTARRSSTSRSGVLQQKTTFFWASSASPDISLAVKPTSEIARSQLQYAEKSSNLADGNTAKCPTPIPYNDLATGVRYAAIAGITPAKVPTKINPGIIHGSHDELKLNQSIRTPVAGIVHGLLNGPKA